MPGESSFKTAQKMFTLCPLVLIQLYFEMLMS